MLGKFVLGLENSTTSSFVLLELVIFLSFWIVHMFHASAASGRFFLRGFDPVLTMHMSSTYLYELHFAYRSFISRTKSTAPNFVPPWM